MSRFWRHLCTTRAVAAKAFPAATLGAIEDAIAASERRHSAEIRLVLEPALDWRALRDGLTPRRRALQLFAELGVWDTAANNGLLVYVLYADHAIEIVADRGFASVAEATWRDSCAVAEAEYRAGRFEAGSLALIARIDAIASELFPAPDDGRNELSNTPLWL